MDGGATTTINNEALRGFIDEIERQFDERRIVTEALRGTYERARAAGFVPAFLREMVRERQMAAEDRQARYRTLDEYRHALGMLADTPLGEAAMERAADEDVVRRAEKPKPFAEQPIRVPRTRPRRVPRKVLYDTDHPQGTA